MSAQLARWAALAAALALLLAADATAAPLPLSPVNLSAGGNEAFFTANGYFF